MCLLPSVKVLLMQESVRRIIEAEESRMGKISNISGRGCLEIMFFKQAVGLFDSHTCRTVWVPCVILRCSARFHYMRQEESAAKVCIRRTLKGSVHIWHKHEHCVDLCVWWIESYES